MSWFRGNDKAKVTTIEVAAAVKLGQVDDLTLIHMALVLDLGTIDELGTRTTEQLFFDICSECDDENEFDRAFKAAVKNIDEEIGNL